MNRLLPLALVALALSLVPPILRGAEEKTVPPISIEELEKEIAKGSAVLLDVNGSKYFAKGHIPGAIDFRAHEKDLASVLGEDKSKLIVVYCGGPHCEAYLAGVAAAREAGFVNLRHLPDGISGWIAAGKQTGPPKETDR